MNTTPTPAPGAILARGLATRVEVLRDGLRELQADVAYAVGRDPSRLAATAAVALSDLLDHLRDLEAQLEADHQEDPDDGR